MNRLTYRWVIITLLVSLIVTGCQQADIPSTPDIAKSYLVDNRFISLYGLLGGENVLGPAISPLMHMDGIDFQFTSAALFEFNTALSADQQVKLSPIGISMAIADHFGSSSDQAQGIEVYPGFLEFYIQIGGESITGKPLTNVLYNSEKSRIEQHFENLGFYQTDSDAPGQVRLLDYGVWMCANECEFSKQENSEVILFSESAQPFIVEINSLSPETIGRPLAIPHIAQDGKIEQIFQNVVFVVPSNDLKEIQLRPIPSMLGMPIQPEISHEIPVLFIEYLEHNIGMQYAGSVVTPLLRLSDHLYRQCFQNLCLDYFPYNPENHKIKPLPLGYLYRDRFYDQADSFDPELQFINQADVLNIWQEFSSIPPNTSQIISVNIQKDQIPLENIKPDLILRLPEDISITFSMPPTQPDGSTSLTLYPINAPNGTSISYDVCVNLFNEMLTCKSESFIIWAQP
ncbi:MAG: hypothetical protein ISR58_18990 [Anaerolineales bacterium]|nr:hypothetical protein [Chloroflexota bacterium]MBL6983269.1 hypothetical protein [Anaerolineales bacterium]